MQEARQERSPQAFTFVSVECVHASAPYCRVSEHTSQLAQVQRLREIHKEPRYGALHSRSYLLRVTNAFDGQKIVKPRELQVGCNASVPATMLRYRYTSIRNRLIAILCYKYTNLYGN
jgi:hypothetical protein